MQNSAGQVPLFGSEISGDGKYPDDGDTLPLHPGEYGLYRSTWYACTPNGHQGNLGAHDVTEHDDGTISVSPSILVEDDTGTLWHGYLERGVWREC